MTVRGPRSSVAALRSWSTDSLILTDLQDSTRVTVAIRGDRNGTIEVLPAETEVVVEVQQYTERTIEVPLTVVGYAGADSVIAFPSVVRVTSAIGLSDYARLGPDEYDVVVDVSGAGGAAVLERPVVVRRAPAYAVATSVAPRTVEVFVIRRAGAASELE